MRSLTTLFLAAVLAVATVMPPAEALAQTPAQPAPKPPAAAAPAPVVPAAPVVPRGPLLPPVETARTVWHVDNTLYLVGLGAMFGVFAFNWLAPTVAYGASNAGRMLGNIGAFAGVLVSRLGLRAAAPAVAGSAAATATVAAAAPAAAGAARAAAPAAGALTSAMLHQGQAIGAVVGVAGAVVGHYLYKLVQVFTPTSAPRK